MAAELLGGALLSGFINVLFERMAPQDVILKFFGGKNIVKLLEELKINLRSANVVLNDAEVKQLTNQDVKNWVDDLTDVIYKADFLLDKIDTEASRRKREDESAASKASKLLNFVSTSFSSFEKTMIVEVQEILEKLNLLLGQIDRLGLKEVQTRSLQRLRAPFVVKESDVYGRDQDKEKIVELLLSDDASVQNLSVIPIVGMGGVGKTTFAQLVYKDRRVQEHFDVKEWVTVSEEFDVFQITKIIFETVTSEKCNIGNLFVLQGELNKALAGKKFLLVLDDVWNENYELWNELKSAFQSGAHGSKIIVTTRSEIVALTMGNVAMHELQLVSDEDCWEIFAKHVFNDNVDSKARTELEEVGHGIVKRCKGLPLAVISMAGLLRSTSNPEEWRKILNSDIWQLQFQQNLKNNVVPALWLSYQFLPPCLKRCFAYCSIFPKDYQFHQDDMKMLIWLWMSGGLLQAEKGKKIEEVGEEYLQDLIVRSFFQYSSDQDETKLVMHDIVHDLAMFISGEFSFWFGDSNDLHNLPTKTRQLSYGKGREVLTKVLTSQTKSLCTLLALPLSFEFFSEKPVLEKSLLHELFMKVGGCLRILSLSESSIMEVPDSIENMKYLRYLDLSRTDVKELPDSICTLYKLQILLLEDCRQLARLPAKFSALVDLRHLNISGTGLTEMPPQMCNLRNLQTLTDFVLGENDGWRMEELGELQLLEGRLRISGLKNIVDVGDVSKVNLKNKKLSELILLWGGESNDMDSKKEREILEALQPHTNLEMLRIDGYRGTLFPDWVGHESYCNMVELELINCKNCCMLPPFEQLPSLRRLCIEGFDGFVSIGNEFCCSSLEDLTLQGMDSLEWSFGNGQEGGSFSRLKELSIIECKKLIVGLPDCPLPSLKEVYIRGCDEMVAVSVCPSLESISVHECPKLESLLEMGLASNLKKVSIGRCDEMVAVYVCPSLESISVGHCPKLESLLEMGLASNLKGLYIEYCKKLWQDRMNWDLQSLSSLRSLYLAGIVDLFPEEGLLPTTLTSLVIVRFGNLKGLNGRAFQHLTSLQQLTIGFCDELECLPEEGLPLSLSDLDIYQCRLLKQRCQRETGEDWPKIQHIPNITINGRLLRYKLIDLGTIISWRLVPFTIKLSSWRLWFLPQSKTPNFSYKTLIFKHKIKKNFLHILTEDIIVLRHLISFHNFNY
ncbi:hypothetical protein UlMin_002774 [Ulmus minor]